MSSRTYEKINRVFPKDENGCTSVSRSYIESIDKFTFSIYPGNNNLLTVTKNGNTKTAYIEDCGSEYVFKLMKSRIKAMGGASGLFEYIDRALFEKFMDCYAWRILNYIMDEMKPAAASATIEKTED